MQNTYNYLQVQGIEVQNLNLGKGNIVILNAS